MSAKRKRFRAESIVARFGARICIRVFAARKENGQCARFFGNARDRHVRLKNMKPTGRGCSRPVAILNGVRIGQGNGFAPLPFAVLADDPAETLEDAADYNFGVQFARGADNMQTAVMDIEKELGVDTIEMTECDSIQEQAQMLHDGEVDAIIYNEAYTENLEEAFENYSDSVRIIYTHEIRVELDFGGSSNITKEPFTVYISGIDVYGDISQSSRSDVNIIATVNPTTKQILLSNTPRDYYVTIPGISGDSKDKLTHAGIYGVDKSMATLENLYDIDIPFYARVNFTSLIILVDAMGGVDVNSEYAFTTNGDGGVVINVQEGINHFDGQQALAFSRERYSLAGGDNQRGKNQMAVIQAMIQKMMTPEMLLKAPDLISQVSDSVETNMSMDQIQELIQSQLNTGGSWTIKSMAAEGTGDSQYCYSMPGTALYVMQPNQASVDAIKNEMQAVENGEILTE